ncbi:hypothetical protein [Microvirga aerophila]|uniref:Uncharacterized protein n=1 Tax=Microvirga aerophila TaxID=670291 RepID=A0A512BNP0_9HYPH|nr:hypothetical protein [Microvirga aerophila]GEO13535.1 hypothetical protein MAE02_12310 [Microvirga aerophila]
MSETPLAWFNLAHVDLYDAATLHNAQTPSGGFYSAPVRFLYFHSIELFLKARLRLRGIEDKILERKPYGRNLTYLLRLCEFAQANEEFTWYQLSMWAARLAPSIFETKSHEWMRTQWRRCAADPHRYRITADDIAWQLQVTNDERLESKLKTIGAIDKPKPERERDRRTKDAARKREARAANGATPSHATTTSC